MKARVEKSTVFGWNKWYTTHIETLHYILSGFDKSTTLNIINHIYNTYGDIEKNNPDQNNMKMIKPYNTEHTLAILIQ